MNRLYELERDELRRVQYYVPADALDHAAARLQEGMTHRPLTVRQRADLASLMRAHGPDTVMEAITQALTLGRKSPTSVGALVRKAADLRWARIEAMLEGASSTSARLFEGRG